MTYPLDYKTLIVVTKKPKYTLSAPRDIILFNFTSTSCSFEILLCISRQDVHMNIDEVEEALRTINGHLLTDKELQFIYHVCKCLIPFTVIREFDIQTVKFFWAILCNQMSIEIFSPGNVFIRCVWLIFSFVKKGQLHIRILRINIKIIYYKVMYKRKKCLRPRLWTICNHYVIC